MAFWLKIILKKGEFKSRLDESIRLNLIIEDTT